MKGMIYRERRNDRVRFAGVVMSHVDGVRIQTVQLIYGVWVRRTRSRVGTLTVAEFNRRFVCVA